MTAVDKLRAGGSAKGTMLRLIRNPAIASIARQAGLDFIMMDMEHGAYGFDGLSDLFHTARSVGLLPLVRVPELTKGYVSRALDCGATGVMVPMIDGPADAAKLAYWTKYPPIGGRGLSSTGGHTDYRQAGAVESFMQEQNRATLSIAQIETKNAILTIDAIASVEGIDALLIGPNDLALSLGHPGQSDAPQVQEAIEAVARAASARNLIFGMHAGAASLEKWRPSGLRLAMSSNDIQMLGLGMQKLSSELQAL